MRDIQVAAVHDGFDRVELAEVLPQRILPFHAVRKAAQLVLRIRRVAADEIEVRIFTRDDAPFMAVDVLAKVIGDGKRLLLRKDRRAGVALLVRAVPVDVVLRQIEFDLMRLQFRLL